MRPQLRLDFMLFCDLDFFAPVPDATTHCRFRNALVKGGVHRRSSGRGLPSDRGSRVEAEVIDATLIERAARPGSTIRTCIPVPTRKRGGSGTAGSLRQATKMTSNGFARPDEEEEGFIDKVHKGHLRTGSEPPGLIPWSKGRTRARVLADKACASRAKRAALRGCHRDGIMRNGPPVIRPSSTSAGFGTTRGQAEPRTPLAGLSSALAR
ncbi:MAG: transposase [Rhodobacteraceae bacterium]|nr:transposase [Paracoccaceae bacterium]